MIFDACILSSFYLNFLFWCYHFFNFLENICNYPIWVVINLIECLPNVVKLFFKMICSWALVCSFHTKVLKVPYFQLLGAKEYQFIYKSVHDFFRHTVVSIFPDSLIIKMSRKGMRLSFSISILNFIFLRKELSPNDTLSMYSDLTKQYISSTNLFHSFTLHLSLV